MQILLYALFMLLGVFFVKKNLIPVYIKNKLNLLQSLALFILLGTMGYKIGINDNLLSNFKIIGKQSLLFAFFTAGGSILFTYIFFLIIKLFFDKKKGGKK